jgi:hypothetical protein
MKKVKGLGAFLVLTAAIAYKFNLVLSKLTSLLKLGVIVLAMLHLSSATDSAAVASKAHNAGKSPRQVAQNVTPKTNGAEKVVGPMAPAQSSGPALLPSAPLGAGPIQAARNAAAAQNAQLAKETGQAVPGAPAARPPVAPAPKPAQPPASNQSTAVVQQGTAKPAAITNVDAPVMRESFDYSRDTRRDPFVSLMTTSDLRPTLSDLRLTGILYDLSGRRPVAILRDIAGGQWRVTTGMTLGRMRVAQIKPKTIIFTIEEFGFNRQDSLVLGDTTRVRHR